MFPTKSNDKFFGLRILLGWFGVTSTEGKEEVEAPELKLQSQWACNQWVKDGPKDRQGETVCRLNFALETAIQIL